MKGVVKNVYVCINVFRSREEDKTESLDLGVLDRRKMWWAQEKVRKAAFSDCIGEDGFTLAWRAQVAKRSEANVPSGTNGKMK